MSKFNKPDTARAAVRSPVTTTGPSGRTFEGAPAHARDPRSELFTLAVSNMVGEKTFYEPGTARDGRYRSLIRTVAQSDPVWLHQMLVWLRTEANMRSAAGVGAAEMVRARPVAGVEPLPYGPTGRSVERLTVDGVCQRADEPGEILAYWLSTYGRPVPNALKRGLADAQRRLYTQRGLLRYDSSASAVRFGDVLDLTHPRPSDDRQSALFKLALDQRHGRDIDLSGVPLPTIAAFHQLRARAAEDPAVLADPDALRAAAMKWETALSLAGDSVGRARMWEALVDSMGYMALLRNLRGLDQADVSDEVAERVAARLADPAEVAASRQFPYRFWSAYKHAPSLRWGPALEKALDAACGNIPSLPGATLVLVDVSGSMGATLSERSKVTLAEVGALFGCALAKRGERVTLAGFATDHFVHRFRPGGSVLRETETFCGMIGQVGWGTRTAEALHASYNGHDRVVIVTDEQTFGSRYGAVSEQAPARVPMYAFNLGGYEPAMMATGSGNRHELGGLTDATFKMINLLERRRDARWPWEISPR